MSDRFFNYRYNRSKKTSFSKKITATELTEFFIKQIEEKQDLNCFITKTFDTALKMAKESDEKIQNGSDIGLLEGIPIGMKDLFCTDGVKTTAGSKILENFVPFYESTVSQNLWRNGAIMLGKPIWMNLLWALPIPQVFLEMF